LTEPTLACPLDFGNASLSSEEPLAAHMPCDMAPVRQGVWLFGKLISPETPAPILTFDSKSDFTPGPPSMPPYGGTNRFDKPAHDSLAFSIETPGMLDRQVTQFSIVCYLVLRSSRIAYIF
jgi:hypothetical protein